MNISEMASAVVHSLFGIDLDVAPLLEQE